MPSRNVILKVENSICLSIETSFSAVDIEAAADTIHDELMDTDDGWNDMKVVETLEKRGYIKLLGQGPEVIDLLF